MKAQELPKFMVRLPRDVKAFVAEQAAINASSQNSEIVRSIRERMDRIAQTTARKAARQTA